MMPIDAGVEVSISLIVTVRAPEQLAPFHLDAASSSVGEPLPETAAARAILAGAVGGDFDRHPARKKGFLTGILGDLAAQLLRLFAIHAPRFAWRLPLGFSPALH